MQTPGGLTADTPGPAHTSRPTGVSYKDLGIAPSRPNIPLTPNRPHHTQHHHPTHQPSQLADPDNRHPPSWVGAVADMATRPTETTDRPRKHDPPAPPAPEQDRARGGAGPIRR